MKSWQWEIDKNTFDLINLDFFVNYRITTLCGYLSIYLIFILKLAFILSDIYTLIKLIVFNTWSSNVQPFISYKICRWLFFGCILLSIVLYLYTMIRSIISYRTRNVSLTYINSGASFMYSVKSYKYYCVYNEISSDSLFTYLAIFCYTNLQNCLILLLCDTPRQIINGITIFKILKFNSSMISVIKEIAVNNRSEAIILSSMTFSFIIWFIFFVKFLFACLIFFPLNYKIRYNLHYEYGLKQYCCIQINLIVQKFMKVKHTKSLENLKRENANIHPTVPDIDIMNDIKSASPTYLAHKDSNMTLVELLNPFADTKEEAAVGEFEKFPMFPTAATTRNTTASRFDSIPEQQQQQQYHHTTTSTTTTTRHRPPPPPLYNNHYNNDSSISIMKNSSTLQDADIISLPSSNSSLSLPFNNNQDDEKLLHNDEYVSKRTLIQDLELPPRSVSNSNLNHVNHTDYYNRSVIHESNNDNDNDNDNNYVFGGIRKFNLTSNGSINTDNNNHHNV